MLANYFARSSASVWPMRNVIIVPVFLRPIVADKRVFDLADHPGPIAFVGEHPVHAQQGSVLAVQQRGQRVVEDVFHDRMKIKTGVNIRSRAAASKSFHA